MERRLNRVSRPIDGTPTDKIMLANNQNKTQVKNFNL